MKIEHEFGNLSEFEKRDVELFRSSNKHETALYFTDVKEENRETSEACFEILRFEFFGGNHQIYVRFPETDYFIEMFGGGSGSCWGDMKNFVGKNIFENNEFEIFSHGDDLLFSIKDEGIPKFNFMKRVASYDKGNKFDRPYPNETFNNYDEIEKALSMKYLKIPESIRRIEYCFKTKDFEKPKYFLVDFPAYNFMYSKHRFFVIENDSYKEFVINNIIRYKDGGTTIIHLSDENGKKHEFFSPTRFSKNICEKFDEEELIEVTFEEKKKLIELLKLNVVSKKESEIY